MAGVTHDDVGLLAPSSGLVLGVEGSDDVGSGEGVSDDGVGDGCERAEDVSGAIPHDSVESAGQSLDEGVKASAVVGDDVVGLGVDSDCR